MVDMFVRCSLVGRTRLRRQAVGVPVSPLPTILCEARTYYHFASQMIMCNRLMVATQSVVVLGPATDALERSRKRRRPEEHATKKDDAFYLQDVYDDLIEHCGQDEESFPSIEWSDSEESETETCRSLAEHRTLSRSRMSLLFPKPRDNGLRRSKSFRTDLSAMNSEEPSSDFLSLFPTTVEPFSPTHCTKHISSKELKTFSSSATQPFSFVFHSLRGPIDEERIHPLNIA